MSGNLYTRRAALAAIPAVGLVPSAAFSATAGVDAHPAWLAEWVALRDAYNSDVLDDADDERVFEHLNDVGRLITFTPARTLLGAAAQLEYAIEDFGQHIFGDIADDLDEVTFRSVLGTLRGLA